MSYRRAGKKYPVEKYTTEKNGIALFTIETLVVTLTLTMTMRLGQIGSNITI